jgi:hypothetical protein
MHRLSEEGDSNPKSGEAELKKTLQVALEDQEIIELMRILMDYDAEGAGRGFHAHGDR